MQIKQKQNDDKIEIKIRTTMLVNLQIRITMR